MQVQKSNTQNVSLLETYFPRRRELYSSGARLTEALLSTHRDGGGMLGWAFDAHSRQGWGEAAANNIPWTAANISADDYAATTNGGPYIDLDGSTEYYTMVDAAWLEQATYGTSFFGFLYCNPTDVVALDFLIGKLLALGNQRSWYLARNVAALEFFTTPAGTGVGGVLLSTANVFVAGEWRFIAYYYNPSTLMQVWYADPSSSTLSTNSVAAAIPAACFNGNADVTLGAQSAGAANFWYGKIGIHRHIWNTPQANIAAFASRLFQSTRWFYQV